ncbi:16916_t:CDS:2 [Entrophospora sp. SA101]|nr:16916_t:CDS:2 [Entrophospora sp. SA101]
MLYNVENVDVEFDEDITQQAKYSKDSWNYRLKYIQNSNISEAKNIWDGKNYWKKKTNGYLSNEEKTNRINNLRKLENEETRRLKQKIKELKTFKKEYQEVFGEEIPEDNFEYYFNIELKLKIYKNLWLRKMKKLVE